MGPVVEWVRRWLGVTQLVAENRRLTAEVRSLRLEVEQMQRNLVAAEREAARATYRGDSNALASAFAMLRRGR